MLAFRNTWWTAADACVRVTMKSRMRNRLNRRKNNFRSPCQPCWGQEQKDFYRMRQLDKRVYSKYLIFCWMVADELPELDAWMLLWKSITACQQFLLKILVYFKFSNLTPFLKMWRDYLNSWKFRIGMDPEVFVSLLKCCRKYSGPFILVIKQLDALNFVLNKFISCLYMFRARVIETYRCMK